MKLTVTNEFVWNFCQFQGYLNTLDRVTSKPVVNLERDVMYAISRTGKKLKGDIELLQEMREKHEKELQVELAERKGNELVAKEGKSVEFKAAVEVFEAEWKTILKKEIDVEVHAIKLSEIPKVVSVPCIFWDVLMEMVQEEKTT